MAHDSDPKEVLARLTPAESARIAEKWRRIRDLALKRMEEAVPTISGKDASIVAGIAEDKLALLREKP